LILILIETHFYTMVRIIEGLLELLSNNVLSFLYEPQYEVLFIKFFALY